MGLPGAVPRRALIVRGAVGADATAVELLHQRGFAGIVSATGVDDALARIQLEHFDLVIVPMAEMHSAHLQLLDRAVQRAQSTFVVGTAETADPDLMLRGFRSGISEFLLLPLQPTEFGAAIDRLLQRIQAAGGGRDGTVIAVYSAKGGVGVTTVAVNLAHALAQVRQDDEVLLADLVTGSGDIRVHLNISPTYDRGDLMQKLDRIDKDLFRSVLTESVDGLWVLPGPDAAELNGALDGESTNVIINQMRQDFGFAVLDCDHYLGDSTIAALETADRILMVTDLSVAALRNTQRALLVARRLGYPDEKLSVVVNRSQSGEALSAVDAQEALKRAIYWKFPNDYRTAAGALTKGVPIARFDAKSKLSVSFRQLAEQLAGSHATASRNGAHPTGRTRMSQLFGRAPKRS
jgi:pilus assembly protein CpaE